MSSIPGAAAVRRWDIDGLDFKVDAVWGLTIARGRFDHVAGSYDVGPNGTHIELTVDARGIVTGNGMWDNLLHSSELSGIAEHPEVRFTSTRVRETDHGKLDVEGRLEATGKVVAVRFDAVVQQAGDRLRLEAAAKIDGQQLGEGGPQLGMLLPATVHLSARLIQAA